MTDEERKDMGNRIKQFLKEHDYNQSEIAREFSKINGISFDAANMKIGRIFNGLYEPDMDFLSFIYKRFSANIGFLITGKGEPHVKPID